MTQPFARRGVLASLAALLLGLANTGAVNAASWSEPIIFDAPGYAYGGDLIVLSPSKLLLVYVIEDPNEGNLFVRLRRSTDGGETWSRPRDFGETGVGLDGSGNVVNLVRLRNGRLWHSRSTDAARSFGPASAMTPRGADVVEFALDHGPGGVVAVVWRIRRGPTLVRVSTDGGASFGQPDTVATARGVRLDDIAIGDGVMYVSYENPQYFPTYETHLKIRWSSDHGATWSGPVLIADEGDTATLTAEGSIAHIAYASWDAPQSTARFATIQYRSTTNAGESWSPPRQLAPRSWDSHRSSIHLSDGVLHAVIGRCTPSWDTCDDERIFYRRSSDGVTWSPVERVSPRMFVDAYPADIEAIGGRVFVSYTGYTWTDGSSVVQIRNP